jgi:hypothetical protein
VRQQDVADFVCDHRAEQQAAALAALDGEVTNAVVERPDPLGAYVLRSGRKAENNFAGAAARDRSTCSVWRPTGPVRSSD